MSTYPEHFTNEEWLTEVFKLDEDGNAVWADEENDTFQDLWDHIVTKDEHFQFHSIDFEALGKKKRELLCHFDDFDMQSDLFDSVEKIIEKAIERLAQRVNVKLTDLAEAALKEASADKAAENHHYNTHARWMA